jgi:hypothetical protein
VLACPRVLGRDVAQQCHELEAAGGLRPGFAGAAPETKERFLDEAVSDLAIARQHTRVPAEPGKLGREIVGAIVAK